MSSFNEQVELLNKSYEELIRYTEEKLGRKLTEAEESEAKVFFCLTYM